MPITFEELAKKFGIVPVAPYGACIIVPGTEFDPDWEDQLSNQGCLFHFVDVAGKPVTLVQKGKDHEEEEEEDSEEPVIESPEKHPVEETGKPDKLWSENDEKLLISLWNAKIKVPTIRAKFLGRSENFLRGRLRKLQRSGKIQSRWKKNRETRQAIATHAKSNATEAHLRWSDKDDDLLIKLWNEDVTVSKIALDFPKRTEKSTKLRLQRLRTAGKIQPRRAGKKKHSEESNVPKGEKVEEKEPATKRGAYLIRTSSMEPIDVPTSARVEIPTHTPTQPTERLVCFESYCRKCRDERDVEDAEVWVCCPLCGGPLIIWNVKVHEASS